LIFKRFLGAEFSCKSSVVESSHRCQTLATDMAGRWPRHLCGTVIRANLARERVPAKSAAIAAPSPLSTNCTGKSIDLTRLKEGPLSEAS
jgi:hypothetical protein